MTKQSEANRDAWNYRVYEFWKEHKGVPEEVGRKMRENPQCFLGRYLELLGEVKGKRIANLLGSNGRKAVPLALLGAEVTVIDISAENQKYALELAHAARVEISFVVADFLELELGDMRNRFDLVYLEGGILHYFSDLSIVAGKVHALLKWGGKLVLNDFHPFRKLLNIPDIYAWEGKQLEISGDYFDSELKPGSVAHRKFFTSEEQTAFPNCLVRYWTMGEIITAFAKTGLVIERLEEEPHRGGYSNIPGEFTLVAAK